MRETIAPALTLTTLSNGEVIMTFLATKLQNQLKTTLEVTLTQLEADDVDHFFTVRKLMLDEAQELLQQNKLRRADWIIENAVTRQLPSEPSWLEVEEFRSDFFIVKKVRYSPEFIDTTEVLDFLRWNETGEAEARQLLRLISQKTGIPFVDREETEEEE